MSPASPPVAKKNPARKAPPPRPDQAASVRREAEALLRELAFVYQLVRAVQQAMSEPQALAHTCSAEG
jgi:hypothetical protein